MNYKILKRFLFFLLIIFHAVFLPWQISVFLVSVFAFYFSMPLELILAGFSLDSLAYTAPPALFTLGFLGIIICSEILKYLIDRESLFGRFIIFFLNLAVFGGVYLII